MVAVLVRKAASRPLQKVASLGGMAVGGNRPAVAVQVGSWWGSPCTECRRLMGRRKDRLSAALALVHTVLAGAVSVVIGSFVKVTQHYCRRLGVEPCGLGSLNVP